MGKLASAVVFSFLAMGCATAEDLPEPTGNTYATLAEFCHARAQAECSPAVVDACKSGSVEACVKVRALVCVEATPQGTEYVAANAPACVALAEQVYKSATLTANDVVTMSDACGRAIFTGPGTARAPCQSSLDCDTATGLDCILPAPAYPGSSGKCLVPNIVPNGVSCAGEADRCTAQSFCDFTTKVCMPAAPVGQICALGADGACAPGSECKGGLIQPATCFPLAPAGAHCTADEDCADGLCDRLASNGNGSCTAVLQMVSIAASCQGFRP